MRVMRHILALAATLAFAASAAAQPTSPITIRFAVSAAGAPVTCTTKITGVGTTRSTVSISDLRFYVSRVRLVRTDGTEVPVALAQDGLWQLDDVALLDFENATGTCVNGTEQTRDLIEGQVPAGEYAGLRFELGLPFEKNHRDPTLQPSPLNLSRLFWSWNAGYKFMRLDMRTAGQPRGWMLHLGSTACAPSDTPTTVPVSCANRNLVAVDLPSFSPARDVVEMDFLALFAGTNVDTNTEKTALGCMSGSTDPECVAMFRQLGLAIGDHPSGTQQVFRAKAAATLARSSGR
jgi:uncharacterized repeat protein (TIGR04052 family)